MKRIEKKKRILFNVPNNGNEVKWRVEREVPSRSHITTSFHFVHPLGFLQSNTYKHIHFKICSPMCVVCSFISVKNNTLVRSCYVSGKGKSDDVMYACGLGELKRRNRSNHCMFVCVFLLTFKLANTSTHTHTHR